MTRHSHQDAVDESTFEHLVGVADELPPPYGAECTFVLYAAGRLGMRAGEIAHISEEWVDWERSLIEIPKHTPCESGVHGGPCGYCKQQARQAAGNDEALSYDEALEQRWQPKTENSVRAIPFDFAADVEAVVSAFFSEFDEFEQSRAAVNRRVDRVLDAAGMDRDELYPHALRATAASWHAYRGLSAAPLQSMFGWNQLTTAQKYIRLSGGATADALRQVHSD